MNRYTYVENNPSRYSDPTGHCPACLLLPIVIEALAAAVEIGGTIVTQQAIFENSAAPKEVPGVSVPVRPQLEVIEGGKSNNEQSNNNEPKPIPVPVPRPKDDDKSSTVIYRKGSDSPWNMTPRAKDIDSGLSFQLSRPIGQSYVETTIGAVDASGILWADIDGADHVSVKPIDGRLEYWQRPTITGDPIKDSQLYNVRGEWNNYTTAMLKVIGSYDRWVARKE